MVVEVAVVVVVVEINTRLAKAAAVFRRLDNVWRSSTLSLKIKLDLYTSLIVSTAIYACKTWKSTVRISQKLDVFHQRNLRKILGVTWRDHLSNIEGLKRTGQRRLQDIVAERRLWMADHIIRMPPGRPANRAIMLCHGLLVEVAANKDMAVRIQRRPCGQRSQLEQRPGYGYRQAQMANSCCPLS